MNKYVLCMLLLAPGSTMCMKRSLKKMSKKVKHTFSREKSEEKPCCSVEIDASKFVGKGARYTKHMPDVNYLKKQHLKRQDKTLSKRLARHVVLATLCVVGLSHENTFVLSFLGLMMISCSAAPLVKRLCQVGIDQCYMDS